jgi:hypothetical protein
MTGDKALLAREDAANTQKGLWSCLRIEPLRRETAATDEPAQAAADAIFAPTPPPIWPRVFPSL